MGSIGVIIVVFAWVVGCTVATGYIGERKGYSFGLFVALGFVLGVLAHRCGCRSAKEAVGIRRRLSGGRTWTQPHPCCA
jgi:hypothetical protein